MNLNYKKIVEVEVWHDYYQVFQEGVSSFLPSYNILNDLDFIPSPDCQRALKNNRLLFKKTAKGFQLIVRVDATTGQPFVPFSPKSRFDFFVVVKNPYFFNFTNLNLTQKDRSLYYFNNLSENEKNALFLTKKMEEFDEIQDYELGDLVTNTGKIYEAKEPFSSNEVFSTSGKWIEVNDTAQVAYVTKQDRLKWQNPNYIYTDANTHAGELISFSLTDKDGHTVSLGNIPNTNQPQGKFKTSSNSSELIYHSINLSGIRSGKYKMRINRQAGISEETFYLLNPFVQNNAFGVIELHTDSSTSFPVDFLGDAPKTYKIRFKNRMTIWSYFNKNEVALTSADNHSIRGLTKQLSAYELNDKSVPDPDISVIYPEVENGNIQKIYSKIYLNIK